MKDYYEVLNISREASMQEVEAAYRNLLKVYKLEDQDNSGGTSLIYEELKEAYLILSDAEKRRLYDRQLLDYDAEREWKRRQLETVGVKKKKKKPFIDNNQHKKKVLIVSTIAAIVFILVLSLTFLNYDKIFNRKEYVSGRQEVQSSNSSSRTVSEAKTQGDDEADTKKPDSSAPAVSEPEARASIENERKESPASPVNDPPANVPKAADPKPEAKPAEATATSPKFNSLEDYFSALGNENHSFSEKASFAKEAMRFFNDKNSNVIIYGTNNVQTGREAISTYLDIIMIQNYKVSILDLKKNNQGKITQISVKEAL